MACALYLILATWKDGRRLLTKKLRQEALDLPSFIAALFSAPPVRVEGTAVFLTANEGVVPSALLHNLKHNKMLHAHNVFLTVKCLEIPRAAACERISLKSLGNSCWQAKVQFGFMDEPDVPKAFQQVSDQGCNFDSMQVSYFLSRDIVVPTIGGEMEAWREKVFAQMHKSASGAADFLHLPSNAVVELGSKIEI